MSGIFKSLPVLCLSARTMILKYSTVSEFEGPSNFWDITSLFSTWGCNIELNVRTDLTYVKGQPWAKIRSSSRGSIRLSTSDTMKMGRAVWMDRSTYSSPSSRKVEFSAAPNMDINADRTEFSEAILQQNGILSMPIQSSQTPAKYGIQILANVRSQTLLCNSTYGILV